MSKINVGGVKSCIFLNHDEIKPVREAERKIDKLYQHIASNVFTHMLLFGGCMVKVNE